MFFVVVGVLIIAMNLAGVGWFATWDWHMTGDLWKFCLPFVLALLWWTWADKSGLNKRREIEKMEARKQARREENLVALGMATGRARRRANRR